MADPRDERPTYAICFIIDDSVKTNEVIKLGNAFTSIVSVSTAVDTNLNEYILKDVTPEVKLQIFIGVARKIPKGIMDKITEVSSGDNAPTNVRFMYFDDGVDITKADMERRLKIWINEQGIIKIWTVDINTDFTGDLLSKFV